MTAVIVIVVIVIVVVVVVVRLVVAAEVARLLQRLPYFTSLSTLPLSPYTYNYTKTRLL